MEEEEEDMEEDIHLEMEDNTSSHAAQKDEDIHPSHMATLDRLKANQRQDYLRGSISGSVQATDRLMKELRDIYRSDSFKKGEERWGEGGIVGGVSLGVKGKEGGVMSG